MARTRMGVGQFDIDLTAQNDEKFETFQDAAAGGKAGLGELTTGMFSMSALALSAEVGDYQAAANNSAIVNYGMLQYQVGVEEAARIAAIGSSDSRLLAEELSLIHI